MRDAISKEVEKAIGRDVEPGELEGLFVLTGRAERIKVLESFDEALDKIKPGSREYASVLDRKFRLNQVHQNMIRGGR
jgi:hypothetical protein